MQTTEHEIQARDWPEDFSLENGNYQCHCTTCGQMFVGYKRRVTCKLCATPTPDVAVEEARKASSCNCDDRQEQMTGAAVSRMSCGHFHGCPSLRDHADLLIRLIAAIESLNRERATLVEGFKAARKHLDPYFEIGLETDDSDAVAIRKALALIEGKRVVTAFADKWSHSCAAVCSNIDLWVTRCPHCGMPAPIEGKEQGR